jgi:hypothetical protein
MHAHFNAKWVDLLLDAISKLLFSVSIRTGRLHHPPASTAFP